MAVFFSIGLMVGLALVWKWITDKIFIRQKKRHFVKRTNEFNRECDSFRPLPLISQYNEMDVLSFALQSKAPLDIYPTPALLLKKLVELAQPHSTHCVEILLLLNLLQDKISAKHLNLLKAVYVQYGSQSYLFDVALFNLVLTCCDCSQKFELLEFIYQNSAFASDFPLAKVQSLMPDKCPESLFAAAL